MIRRRIRAWWQSRLQPADHWTLTQRNVYIVPTRAGLAFAATLLLLLLASINYQLNLGYALTFLLAGSAAASMHMTHANLRGLTLHVRPAPAVHAGEATSLVVVVTNPGGIRHGLGFGPQDLGDARLQAWTDAEADGQTQVTVRHLAPRRGCHALPLLRVETRFPFGLFRAWSVWRPRGEHWVWPRLEPQAPPLPAGGSDPLSGGHTRAAPTGDFEGVRPWRRGDSPRQIAWKKAASTGALVSRDSQESSRLRLWLDWDQAGGATDPESRLARLATWAVQAQARDLPFGLNLPGRQVPCASGAAHLEQALKACALWPGRDGGGHP